MKKVLFGVVLLFWMNNLSAAQAPDTMWTRTYGDIGIECAKSVQQTSDGGYIILGTTQHFITGQKDIYLIKTDSNGDTLWTKTYEGHGIEVCYEIQQTFDGGYIMVVRTQMSVANMENIYLIKTDVKGNILWTKKYDGRPFNTKRSVKQTLDSCYIVLGSTPGNRSDIHLIKIDTSGDYIWSKTYGGKDTDIGYSVNNALEGGYIIAGLTKSYGAGDYDVYVIKTDNNGDTVWTRTFGGKHTDWIWPGQVQVCSDSGYIIVGETFSFGPGVPNYDNVYLIKLDKDGNMLWTKVYGGSQWDQGYSVQETSDSGYILVGYTSSFGTYGDIYLIRTNNKGDTLWTKTFGGRRGDAGAAIQVTTDGGYIIAGYTRSFGAGKSDIYLIKLKPDTNTKDNKLSPNPNSK